MQLVVGPRVRIHQETELLDVLEASLNAGVVGREPPKRGPGRYDVLATLRSVTNPWMPPTPSRGIAEELTKLTVDHRVLAFQSGALSEKSRRNRGQAPEVSTHLLRVLT